MKKKGKGKGKEMLGGYFLKEIFKVPSPSLPLRFCSILIKRKKRVCFKWGHRGRGRGRRRKEMKGRKGDNEVVVLLHSAKRAIASPDFN